MTVALSSSSRRCPSGCGSMQQFTFRGVTLDTCPACAGIWFDGREYDNLRRLPEDAFHTLEELARPKSTSATPEYARQCPTCAILLIPVPVRQAGADVRLDKCPHCDGLWADDRELEALSQALQADKPSFIVEIPDEVRDEIARAVAQQAAPTQAQRSHLFQSLVAWLNRPL